MRGYVRFGGAIAALAMAGCPAPAQGPQIVLSSASPGAAGATSPAPTALATRTPAAGPTATPVPAPSLASRPLGAGPEGGSLADVAAAVGEPVKDQYRITFATTQGDFVVTLFPERAVKASAKFLALSREGVYERTTFHRVIPGFVAQGGDYLSKDLPPDAPAIGTGNWGDPVPDDFGNGLKHLPGAVALAHTSAPNSSYSQFYICLQRLTQLDNGYTVFGQVIAGWDTVQRLTFTEKDGKKTGATPDRILKVTVAE